MQLLNCKRLKDILKLYADLVAEYHEYFAYKHDRTAAGSGGKAFITGGKALKDYDRQYWSTFMNFPPVTFIECIR